MNNATNWTRPGYPVLVRATGEAGVVTTTIEGRSLVRLDHGKAAPCWVAAADLDPDMRGRDAAAGRS